MSVPAILLDVRILCFAVNTPKTYVVVTVVVFCTALLPVGGPSC